MGQVVFSQINVHRIGSLEIEPFSLASLHLPCLHEDLRNRNLLPIAFINQSFIQRSNIW